MVNNLKNSVETQIDAKTRLQEYSLLKKFKILPIYKLLESKGVQIINQHLKLSKN